MAEPAYWEDYPDAAPAGESAAGDPAVAAWLLVLDVLEMAVVAAEKTLKDPLGPLSAPEQPGEHGPLDRVEADHRHSDAVDSYWAACHPQE